MDKKRISRRKLLGGAGKLAYVAPTLTLLSMVTGNAHALSTPPCSPNEPGCAQAKPQRRDPPKG
jgi:hypothetical protein